MPNSGTWQWKTLTVGDPASPLVKLCSKSEPSLDLIFESSRYVHRWLKNVDLNNTEHQKVQRQG